MKRDRSHGGAGPAPEAGLDLTVVIPCYNGEATLGAQLEALAQQGGAARWELVVADNGSTDASMEVVEAYRGRIPGLRIVDASARRGQPYALNVGWRAARAEAVAFVDADDVVGEGWVEAMAEALRDHALVGSRHEVERLNPAWVIHGRGAAQEDAVQRLWYPPWLPHVGGCGLGTRRSLLERHGGFDEALPCCHDTDLCLRLQRRAAIRLVLEPAATVHIRFRTSVRATFRQARGWARCNCLVYRRHRSRPLRGPWRRFLRMWRLALWSRRAARLARSREGRLRLAWDLGWNTGLLIGAVRYRVTPPVFGEKPPEERGAVDALGGWRNGEAPGAGRPTETSRSGRKRAEASGAAPLVEGSRELSA